jgi:hypothetical protein
MNLGIQDATSLAWRLAMFENGTSLPKDVAERMWSSYSTERWTVARAVVDNVQAQIALFTATNPAEVALRNVFSEALSNPYVNAMWSQRITGFGDPSAAYSKSSSEVQDGGDMLKSWGLQEDSLLGTRITSKICGSTIEELFRATRPDKFLLLERNQRTEQEIKSDETDLQVISRRWKDRLTALSISTASSVGSWEDIEALLVRPDMLIAWVARSQTPIVDIQSSLATVLEQWFGK